MLAIGPPLVNALSSRLSSTRAVDDATDGAALFRGVTTVAFCGLLLKPMGRKGVNENHPCDLTSRHHIHLRLKEGWDGD